MDFLEIRGWISEGLLTWKVEDKGRAPLFSFLQFLQKEVHRFHPRSHGTKQLRTADFAEDFVQGFHQLSFLSSGEIVVNEVNFVRKCIATDTSQYDLWGKLVCSNFKISFITDDTIPLQVGLECTETVD